MPVHEEKKQYDFARDTVNRGQLQQFFITFPHTTTTKAEFISSLPPTTYYKVANETHKDGSPHLHGAVITEAKWTKVQLLKHFASKFPHISKSIHIRPIRNLKGAIEYMDKEDPTPVSKGSCIISKKKSKRTQQEIRDGHFAYMLNWSHQDDFPF